MLYDAVRVPGGSEPLGMAELDEVQRFIAEAFRHGEAIGGAGDAAEPLPPGVEGSRVVVVGSDVQAFVDEFTYAIGQHRFPEREGARGGIGGGRRG